MLRLHTSSLALHTTIMSAFYVFSISKKISFKQKPLFCAFQHVVALALRRERNSVEYYKAYVCPTCVALYQMIRKILH